MTPEATPSDPLLHPALLADHPQATPLHAVTPQNWEDRAKSGGPLAQTYAK